MSKFIGREQELSRLKEALRKKTSSFIIIKGRRRIGKSRLISEFSHSFKNYYCFSGIPPQKNTTQGSQLLEFSRQMAQNFNSPFALYQNWNDALLAVAERLKTGQTLLVFDEISWMGSKDPDFLGKIKNFWDLHIKKNDQLIFIICGSASAWIQKNILNHTGFVGRISFTLTLRELRLQDCNTFWPNYVSAYEKLKILAITGGVPKYLEEIDPHKNAEDNIKRLCFTEGGILVEEFNQIFSDIFLRKSDYYKKIIHALSHTPKDLLEIQQLLKLNSNGRLSDYLWELELAGFIARDYTWNLETGIDSKLNKYRLQDNYLRFYCRYIQPNLSKIKRHSFALKSLSTLAEWPSIAGLQFENLILNNRHSIHQAIGISPEDIICENPFFQKNTSKKTGCQIDYLIQTKFNTLYICEIKFSKNTLGSSVISEVQNKIQALKADRKFSCRPVLIHVNGVTEDLIAEDFFAHIIDFGKLFDV